MVRNERVAREQQNGLKPPHALQNEMILGTRLEMRDIVHSYLRDSVSVMPGTYYGADSFTDFEKELCMTIASEPQLTHILTASGDPGSGKTTLVDEIAQKLMRGDTLLSWFARENGYTFRLTNLPWGDAFHLIPDHLRVRGVSYQDDPELLLAKQREIAEANSIYSNAFERVLGRQKEKGIIDIVTADMPAITGMVTSDGEVIGIPRGFELLEDLGKSQGAFEEFGGSYTMHSISLVATWEIRNISKEIRAAMLSLKDPEEIAQEMARRGLEFHVSDTRQIMDYVLECAPPDEMDLLDQDVYYFMRELAARFGSSDESLERIRPEILRSYDAFVTNDGLRMVSVGQGLHPFLYKEVGIDSGDAIILRNDTVLPRTRLFLDIEAVRPLAQ